MQKEILKLFKMHSISQYIIKNMIEIFLGKFSPENKTSKIVL
jgi:hypothetical protein